jgi:hypothetical protein
MGFPERFDSKGYEKIAPKPPCDTRYVHLIPVTVGSHPCVFFAELEEESGGKITLLRRRGLFF